MFLYRVQIDEFQSLLGFLMRCDLNAFCYLVKYPAVSIPAGFSDALRHKISFTCGSTQKMFQSLLGFLMRCDLKRIK